MKNQFKIIVRPRKTKREYIYDYVAEIVNKKDDFIKIGSGLSLDSKTAKYRAIFEAIERYYSSKNPSKFFQASVDYLKKKKYLFLDPKEIISFKNVQYVKQFPYQRFRENIPVKWVKGWSFSKNCKIFVPAFIIYLRYKTQTKKDKPFIPSTSCGVAVQKSLEEATMHAILELLERDTAMITWLAKRKVPCIDLNSVDDNKIKELITQIENEGLKPLVFVSTADINIPSVIGVIYDPADKIPVATFGLSSDFNLIKAIKKSLEEALMIRNTAEILQSNGRLKKIQESQIKCFLDHVIFYAFPENKKYWKFLLRSPVLNIQEILERYKFSIKTPPISEILNYFYNKNMDVIRIDLSDQLLKKIGLHVVRVIIPGLSQMNANHGIAFLGDKGRPRVKIYSNNFNKAPHPFG